MEKDTRKYKIKVNCLTPKNQAQKCMEKWKRRFPTFKKPIEQKRVSDHEFYWIYKIEGLDNAVKFQTKVLLLEDPIKKVMRFEMKHLRKRQIWLVI